MSSEQWPDGLSRIAKVVGEPATLALVQEYGGTKGVYIPRKPSWSHPWARVLGRERWPLLCQAFGGQQLELPRGAFLHLAKVRILELGDQGLTNKQIALRVGCTMRYVSQVLNMAQNDRQMKLFQS